MKVFQALKKSRTGSGLLTFGAAMAAMTVIAGTADSFMLPQVTVGGFQSMSLEYPMNIRGRISAEKASAVYGEEGLRVGGVEVSEGDLVEAGEVLFTYDMEFLDKKIREEKKELHKLTLQLDNAKSNKELLENKKRQSLSRAKKDYKDTLNSTGMQENAAYKEMEAARLKLENFRNNPPERGTPEIGDLFTDSAGPPDEWQAQAEALSQEYHQKKQMYQELLDSTRESRKSAYRQVEDAAYPAEKDSSTELLELERADILEHLPKLKKVKKTEGKIRSKVSGEIKNINVKVGGITGTDVAVLMEDFGGDFRFEGVTDEKSVHVLNVGDSCRLYLKETGKYIENQKIEQIRETEAEQLTEEKGDVFSSPGSYKVTVSVESEMAVQSGRAELILEGQSGYYDRCVPLTALYESDGETYIFITEDKATILGMETVASRVPVKVLEKNDAYAAVDGSFGFGARVITKAEKNISDGERVKVSKGL